MFTNFWHTMYKYMLNSVVKISLTFAQYFEYYGIILGGGVFLWTHRITRFYVYIYKKMLNRFDK